MKLCEHHESQFVPLYGHEAVAKPVLRDEQSFEIRRSRRVIVGDYCQEFVRGKDYPDLVYQDTDDLLETAQECARTILANVCPDYVAVTRHRDGQTKIIKRSSLDAKPHLFQQLVEVW